MNYYTGFGARVTPPHILEIMTNFAIAMEKKQWILRHGDCLTGADAAFKKGASLDNQDIFLPEIPPERAYAFIYRIRKPFEFSRYKPMSQKLLARNVKCLLGNNYKEPSKFALGWTPEGKPVGGSGFVIDLANALKIPVYNLYYEEHYKALQEFYMRLK